LITKFISWTEDKMLFESIFYPLIFSLCFADFDGKLYYLVIIKQKKFFSLWCIETLLYCKILPAKLTNGLIKRDRVSYYNGQGYLGNMEYECLPGFDLNGNKMVTCENGIWTIMPQCIRILSFFLIWFLSFKNFSLAKKRCLPIKIYPLNSIAESDNITLYQNDPQQIIVGSTIILRCMDKYEFDPTSNGSLIIQCQNDGSWTPMPSCRCKCLNFIKKNFFFSYRYSSNVWLFEIIFTSSITYYSNEF
jgi:hypothetical protein